MHIFVAGGAGFIGANFIDLAISRGHQILAYDLLTYAGNRRNLEDLPLEQCQFVQGDICDGVIVSALLARGMGGVHFDAVVNFAAESHVDRSIVSTLPFVRSNVLGAVELIEASRNAGVPTFVQISTDEVYGSAAPDESFTTMTRLNPSSGYSASKAAADHLVMSYHITHGYDVRITRCTNNYGRFQYPEKLIPTIITRALAGESIPVFGDGGQVRDWLFVDDHCEGILAVVERGVAGETYHFGSANPDTMNLQLVQHILKLLACKTGTNLEDYLALIRHVDDRPGGDRRYALDWSITKQELGWEPKTTLMNGLERTVEWYLENRNWWGDFPQN